MSGEVESVKTTIIEALVKEEGEATAERMLYAFHRIKERFRSVEELIEFVEENLAGEVEVRRFKHYPYRDDVEPVILLRLRNPLKKSEAATVLTRPRESRS